MHSFPTGLNQVTILWIYIVLLFLGGLVGYLKAGSKISLIMSASFAGILILCNTNAIFTPTFVPFADHHRAPCS